MSLLLGLQSTSTTLYFHDVVNAQSGTFPTGEQSATTPDETWSTATTLRMMDTTIGASQVSVSNTSIASVGAQAAFIRFYTSPPLTGSTSLSAGTWTYFGADSESDLNANFWVNGLNVYVWRPSTGAKIGTVIDTTSGLGGAEPTSANSEQVTTFTFAGSSVAGVQDGDTIVCEVWSTYTQGLAVGYTTSFYYDGTVDTGNENDPISSAGSKIVMPFTVSFSAVTSGKSVKLMPMFVYWAW